MTRLPTEASEELRLRIHHVGGRDGEIGGFPTSAAFVPDYLVTIYEGDPDCLAQIGEVNGARGYRHRIRPAILAEQSGPTTLHLNYCPCTSSLLPTVDLPFSAYKFLELLGDYVYPAAFRTVRELRGSATTLDAVACEDGSGMDFLSLDTQGTENHVLAGARDQLRQNVVGVVCEVAVREVYKGQALLGDVIRQMSECGFDFIRLLGHDPGSFSQYRKPLGSRALGMMDFDDALFFKRIANIRSEQAQPGLALFKQAFFALSYGHLEWALEALDVALELDASLAAEHESRPRYFRFLCELHALCRDSRSIFPPRFDELFSLEESFARFGEHIPHHWNIYDTKAARRRYFASNDVQVFKQEIPKLLAPDPTPLERLLHDNGFSKVAAIVASKRREQAQLTIRMLHLTRRTADGHVLDSDLLEQVARSQDDPP